MDVPVVTTAHLILRGQRLADFEAVAAMWAHPDVTRYIDGKPRPREECWLKFLRGRALWSLLGYGYWIIEEQESGAFVGEIGIADFKRDFEPPIDMQHEMGWAVSPAFHGKGFASEAAAGAVAWSCENLSGATLSCIIDPGNAPSIRIAEKCGFTRVGHATYHGDEVIAYSR